MTLDCRLRIRFNKSQWHYYYITKSKRDAWIRFKALGSRFFLFAQLYGSFCSCSIWFNRMKYERKKKRPAHKTTAKLIKKKRKDMFLADGIKWNFFKESAFQRILWQRTIFVSIWLFFVILFFYFYSPELRKISFKTCQ